MSVSVLAVFVLFSGRQVALPSLLFLFQARPLVLRCCLLHVTCRLVTVSMVVTLGLLLFPNPGGRGLVLLCNTLSSFWKPMAPELLAGP